MANKKAWNSLILARIYSRPAVKMSDLSIDAETSSNISLYFGAFTSLPGEQH